MHNRKVSRIITPGTLIDEDFMDPFSNNYVLAIHIHNHKNTTELQPGSPGSNDYGTSPMVGLAWLDLSTGHFFTQSSTLMALPSFLSRIEPREIVLGENLQDLKGHGIFAVLEEADRLVSYVSVSEEAKLISTWTSKLESPIPTKTITDFTPEEIMAGSTLLQ